MIRFAIKSTLVRTLKESLDRTRNKHRQNLRKLERKILQPMMRSQFGRDFLDNDDDDDEAEEVDDRGEGQDEDEGEAVKNDSVALVMCQSIYSTETDLEGASE